MRLNWKTLNLPDLRLPLTEYFKYHFLVDHLKYDLLIAFLLHTHVLWCQHDTQLHSVAGEVKGFFPQQEFILLTLAAFPPSCLCLSCLPPLQSQWATNNREGMNRWLSPVALPASLALPPNPLRHPSKPHPTTISLPSSLEIYSLKVLWKWEHLLGW